jgi:hypothetical protein
MSDKKKENERNMNMKTKESIPLYRKKKVQTKRNVMFLALKFTRSEASFLAYW